MEEYGKFVWVVIELKHFANVKCSEFEMFLSLLPLFSS